MRVFLTGAGGLLGSEVAREARGLGWEVVAPSRAQVDVCDAPALVAAVGSARPDAVVHCAAWTDVDGCESGRDRAFRVNALGARNAALAARRAGAKILFVSTDYVFDGAKDAPYTEFDPVGPISVYGASKEAGERMVREQTPEHFILRVAWLYGRAGRSFPATIAGLARRLAGEGRPLRVVADQRGTPTWTRDVARQICTLLPTEAFGTLHATAHGETTWHGFARRIVASLGIGVEVEPCTTEEFPRPAPRPRSSVLDNLCLRLQGLDVMRPWEEGWDEYVAETRRGGSPTPSAVAERRPVG